MTRERSERREPASALRIVVSELLHVEPVEMEPPLAPPPPGDRGAQIAQLLSDLVELAPEPERREARLEEATPLLLAPIFSDAQEPGSIFATGEAPEAKLKTYRRELALLIGKTRSPDVAAALAAMANHVITHGANELQRRSSALAPPLRAATAGARGTAPSATAAAAAAPVVADPQILSPERTIDGLIADALIGILRTMNGVPDLTPLLQEFKAPVVAMTQIALNRRLISQLKAQVGVVALASAAAAVRRHSPALADAPLMAHLLSTPSAAPPKPAAVAVAPKPKSGGAKAEVAKVLRGVLTQVERAASRSPPDPKSAAAPKVEREVKAVLRGVIAQVSSDAKVEDEVAKVLGRVITQVECAAAHNPPNPKWRISAATSAKTLCCVPKVGEKIASTIVGAIETVMANKSFAIPGVNPTAQQYLHMWFTFEKPPEEVWREGWVARVQAAKADGALDVMLATATATVVQQVQANDPAVAELLPTEVLEIEAAPIPPDILPHLELGTPPERAGLEAEERVDVWIFWGSRLLRKLWLYSGACVQCLQPLGGVVVRTPCCQAACCCEECSAALRASAAHTSLLHGCEVYCGCRLEVATADGLQLQLSPKSATGYEGVWQKAGGTFEVIARAGESCYHGVFDTAFEAAAARARVLAATGTGMPPPPWLLLPTEADGLQLHLSATSSTGYKRVTQRSGRFQAEVREDGKKVILGNFGTAVEAAVAVARHAAGLAPPRTPTASEAPGTSTAAAAGAAPTPSRPKRKAAVARAAVAAVADAEAEGDDPEGDDPRAAPPSGKRARAASPSDESDGGSWSGDSDSG